MRFSVIAVSMFAGAAMAATSTDYASYTTHIKRDLARSTQVSTTVYPKTSSTESVIGSSVTPASKPSNSAPGASSPASSNPVSSAPAASSPATSAPASSKPATSVLVPVASSPASGHPVSSAPAASSPAGSAPASSNPAPPAANSTKPANTFTPIYATSATSALGVATTPAGSVSVIAITTCIPTVIYSTISLTGVETSAPGVPAGSAKPSSTGYISTPANGSTPSATATPAAFTGAATNVQVGGAAIAALFGLAAFFL
ncbi:hypothetical protein SBOR_5758 [Sclerotinia borealis F-4128]|uniref:GPI anchored serine-rich protein n=1 Tax=Sclerotinia borealis (strain F-4128) TaxID=1432307 RepID=W9CDD3_SCLBF|nr:hypothetical protein SBOR_5758 [Sclerotinia borealis F-4128]